MNENEINWYRCPLCKSKLSLKINTKILNDVIEGLLYDDSGHSFKIKDGIPELLDYEILNNLELQSLNEYEKNADIYDENLDFFFKTMFVNEKEVRQFISKIIVASPSSTILEVGCGTGRDSQFILNELSESGKLYLQDISKSMLEICRSNLSKSKNKVEFAISNGSNLPFDDGMFDTVFHFGGLNTFSDIGKTLEEFSRVTKIGGKVIVGDEGISPWLRKTQYGKYLINSNSLFDYDAPLEFIPTNSFDAKIQWLMGGSFYLIEYSVGEGEPQLNIDIDFPGFRGGSHKTRYFGNLEGVTIETKELATSAVKKSNKSMHKWLDDIVKNAAKKELGIR